MNKFLKLVLAIGLIVVGFGEMEGAAHGYIITGLQQFCEQALLCGNADREQVTHFAPPIVNNGVASMRPPIEIIFIHAATTANFRTCLAKSENNRFPLVVSFKNCDWLTDADLKAFINETNGNIVSLNLTGCKQITDHAIGSLAGLCGDGCRIITDPGVGHQMEVTQRPRGVGHQMEVARRPENECGYHALYNALRLHAGLSRNNRR